MELTKEIREYIAKRIIEAQLNGIPKEEPVIAISNLVLDLNDANEILAKEEEYRQIKRAHLWVDLLVGVTFIDAYKMMNHYHKSGLNSQDEENWLDFLCKIQDINDIVGEVSADPQILHKLLILSYEFYQLDYLSKIQVIKSLDVSDIEFFLKEFSYFQEDLDHYDIDITLDLLLKEWKKKEKHQMLFSEVKPELNLIKIDGFIQSIMNNNLKNGIHLLGEIALMDYRINEQLLSFKEITEKARSILDFYEKYSYGDIIYYLQSNQKERLEILREIREAKICGCVYNISIDQNKLKSDKTRKIDRKLLNE